MSDLRDELLRFYNSTELHTEEVLKKWRPFVEDGDIVKSIYTIRKFIKHILKLE